MKGTSRIGFFIRVFHKDSSPSIYHLLSAAMGARGMRTFSLFKNVFHSSAPLWYSNFLLSVHVMPCSGNGCRGRQCAAAVATSRGHSGQVLPEGRARWRCFGRYGRRGKCCGEVSARSGAPSRDALGFFMKSWTPRSLHQKYVRAHLYPDRLISAPVQSCEELPQYRLPSAPECQVPTF